MANQTNETVTIINQLLVDTINTTKEQLSNGFLFAKTEIPDIVNQLLTWKLTYSLISNLIGILIIITCIGIIHWQIYDMKRYKNSNQYINDKTCYSERSFRYGWYINGGIFLNLVLIVPIIIAISCINFTWLKILIAPKLYLIEYVATLLK